MFAAFMLGVPMFAVVVKIVPVRSKDPRFDKLANESVKLLVVTASDTSTRR